VRGEDDLGEACDDQTAAFELVLACTGWWEDPDHPSRQAEALTRRFWREIKAIRLGNCDVRQPSGRDHRRQTAAAHAE